MTFTVGNSHDWTARGLLAAIVWSAAFAAILFNEVTIDRPAWRKAGVVFAILLLPIGLYGQWRFRAHAPQPDMLKSMKEVHETYPLGTIFYNEDPKHSRMISVIPAAGRMLISFPPPSHIAYTNRVDVLEPLLNLRSVFEPCETTWYGKSTPQDTFVLISKDGVFQGALCQ